MDGNFKAEHMHDKKPDDQVFLMDAMGYMVGQTKYHDYLKAAKDAPEGQTVITIGWRTRPTPIGISWKPPG
ncbi:hypothetical protein PAXRUDRAFT_21146 [Paxillus rubicundulus Ve08.2h10]|uniref:Unplaced genomic scaffold scaffold_5205, whole genome shotgun sequence n=1 Tax=Paxillus rubicundulus Ve08.2h10 TaxID=930991 RepID=A0A0D0BNK7_9AGAM|nr:hypothetical protein PAXRUDRAFT_21146 [Paxillus rubicundulus Ve08.2h10]